MKKKLLILFITVIAVSLSAVTAGAYIAGDTDNDFLVTAKDARFALRLSVNLEECDKDSDQYKAADANGDGTVTASDARTILRVSVGLDHFKENTEKNQNILITKMPYKTNGLVINSIKTDGDYFVLSITNKTSNKTMAVAESSKIPYKMYNKNGDVIESGSAYVSQMNNGESCNVKIRKVKGTEKLIFGSATVNYTEAVIVSATEVINGITVSKAPFSGKGITVNDIEIDTERKMIHIDITNKSGTAAAGSVKFTAYDASGNSLGNISVSIFSINNGEKIFNGTYYPTGTKKIILNDINIYATESFTEISDKTMSVDGLTLTKLPATAKKIEFNFISVERSYSGAPTVKVKVTNKTGKALDDTYSEFYYKAYDKDGYVLGISRQKILQLNAGESFIAELSLQQNTTRLEIGNVTAKEGTALSPGKTSVVDGLTTNALSKIFGGLEISEITVNRRSTYTDITFKLKNKTGKTVSGTCELFYKVLSSDNTVLKTSSVYTSYNLNNGEYVYKTVSVTDTDVTQLYFFEGEIRSGVTVKDSASYQTVEGVKITAAPCTIEGLKIASYRYEDGKIYVRIENKTGSAVKSSSYLDYKVYGTNGAVIRENALFCNQMDKGESCEVSFYIPDSAAKITFYAAKVYSAG